MPEYLEIPIDIVNEVMLRVYPQSSNAEVLDDEQAAELGESRWQLVEGEEYEFEFSDNKYRFEEHELVRPSKSNASRGIIKTGIYVGCLTLAITDDSGFKTEVNFLFDGILLSEALIPKLDVAFL